MGICAGGDRLPGAGKSPGPVWQWPVISLGLAAWGVMWTWGLLAITRPFPGIISSRAGIGALELLEIPTGRSYPLVLVAIFLLCLLPPLLVGMLRNFLDSDREAVAALLWPLRSRGFVLASIAWTIAGVCWVVVLDEGNWLRPIGYVALIVAWVMTPFLSWNPATLDDEVPTRWYRPWWPGRRTLIVCLVLWLAYTVLNLAADGLASIVENAALAGTIWLAGDAISACLLVATIVVWLSRGNWRSVHEEGTRLVRSRFVGEYLWQYAAIVVIGGMIAAPAALIALDAIFVLPQYDEWIRQANGTLPWWWRLLSGIYSNGTALVLVASVPAGIYLNLAQARLIRRHGVGRGLASSGG